MVLVEPTNLAMLDFKGLHYAHNVSAGMCHVNGSPIHDQPHVPFGGSGESGIGREGTGGRY